MNPRCVMIVAGGTGGHIYPALAVAEVLQKCDVGLHWLGSTHGMEQRIVADHGIALTGIAIAGLRGRGWRRWAAAPFAVGYATLQAIIAILRVKPRVVLGMGGFVCGPGGLAAWLCRKPLVIHEQNAIPGLTNRLLSRIATRVLGGYPARFGDAGRVTITGNPVRAAIARVPPPEARLRDPSHFKVLVVGGSLGAQVLNSVVPAALAELDCDAVIEVRHQTGAADVERVREAYARSRLDAAVAPFIADMAEAYAWADLVICRAGAITVAELAAAGVASILVPYPHAVDDHQTANARYLATRDAAILIPNDELSPARLGATIAPLIADRPRLLLMARRARDAARPEAADRVARICLEYVDAAA